jgi:formate/nitrite transporter FocA (FNT family)
MRAAMSARASDRSAPRPSDDASPRAEQHVAEEAESRAAPPGEVVYEAIYREGRHELDRRNSALAWSGLAAGLSMGFSLVAEALLRRHLPDARWTPAVAKIGYSVGFLIVILGRQQLFTKNTLTVILPLLSGREGGKLRDVARLWVVVLGTNLAGAFGFALLLAHTRAFGPAMQATFAEIAAEMPLDAGFLGMMLRAVLAGWLIALMIWQLPFAAAGRVWVIVLLAYLVGLGGFPHIVAESVAAFYAVLAGQLGLGRCVLEFMAPTLLGNIIGGVAIVAALAHAEFVSERREHAGGGR